MTKGKSNDFIGKIKKTFNEIYSNIDSTYFLMIIISFVGYILIHDLIGETFLQHNNWDSYTLQAKAWLEGKIGLGKNYDYLELAIYNNDWYVSFPPFPSVAMLPWVIIYGVNTPNNAIMFMYILIAITLVYSIARYFKMRNVLAAFWSMVVVYGCNIFWMSTMGGVWFQAQLLNMILCLAAIYAMLNNKRILSYICIALAVGCRPFSIVYFLVLIVYYYKIDTNKESEIVNKEDNNVDKKYDNRYIVCIRTVLKQWPGLISAACIGIIYMIYNYVRFDSVFEFGHNYLPEFVNSKDGQFNISYVLTNLYRIFVRQVNVKDNMGLDYVMFDGFNVFVANPIFVIFLVCIIYNIIRKNIDVTDITIIISILVNIFFLCMHKTLGGWQFGNRYLVDMIPFIMLYVFMTKDKFNKINRVANWERLVAAFAVMFNAYGVIVIYLDQVLR